jgi:hypothetical protein
MPPTLRYPSGVEYREALYNTKVCFKDPALIGGTVAMDKLGMPKPISGASGSVFTVGNTSGRRWAVKCFTRFVDHQEIRYQRITESLQRVSKPWRVEFEYLSDGILSQGAWYPALKMEWVEGTGLIPFIENNLWEPVNLGDLAAKFAQLVRDLSALGIAHGDLQHDNLLVTSSGDLKLIDYDGMFVPSLAQMGASEKGHINYQSPARTMNTWGPYLDNFSAWIIYGSLVALTIDPTLWTLLHDQGDDALLFNHADFADKRNSRALLALAHSPRADLQALGNAMSRLWMSDVRAIPSLDPTTLPAAGIQPGAGGHVPSTAAKPSAKAAGGTIPDWVTQTQVRAQATGPGSQGSASWVTGHLAPLPLVGFHPSRIALRLLAALGLAAVVAVGVSARLGILSVVIAGPIALTVALVFILITIALFHRTPEWPAKREKLTIFKARRTESSKAAREVSSFEHARRGIDNREQKAIDKVSKQAEKAKASEKKDLADLEKRLAAQTRSLEKQKQRLQASEMRETGNALRTYQHQHVANYLSRASINTAGIPGIGPGVIRSLAANGIYSAADFTGLQYQTGPRGGQHLYIRRRDGVPVHPSGVGEKKASDLENWRRSIENAAIATQPSSLPTAHAQTIRTKYAQQRQALADQEQAAHVQAANEQGQIRQKWATTHAAFSRELATTRQAFAQERAQADRHLTMAQKQASTAVWQRELAERELAAYHDVSYRRYLAGVIRT